MARPRPFHSGWAKRPGRSRELSAEVALVREGIVASPEPVPAFLQIDAGSMQPERSRP